jgi:hypothetical protein
VRNQWRRQERGAGVWISSRASGPSQLAIKKGLRVPSGLSQVWVGLVCRVSPFKGSGGDHGEDFPIDLDNYGPYCGSPSRGDRTTFPLKLAAECAKRTDVRRYLRPTRNSCATLTTRCGNAVWGLATTLVAVAGITMGALIRSSSLQLTLLTLREQRAGNLTSHRTQYAIPSIHSFPPSTTTTRRRALCACAAGTLYVLLQRSRSTTYRPGTSAL